MSSIVPKALITAGFWNRQLMPDGVDSLASTVPRRVPRRVPFPSRAFRGGIFAKTP
jgi:hypothetical protein